MTVNHYYQRKGCGTGRVSSDEPNLVSTFITAAYINRPDITVMVDWVINLFGLFIFLYSVWIPADRPTVAGWVLTVDMLFNPLITTTRTHAKHSESREGKDGS